MMSPSKRRGWRGIVPTLLLAALTMPSGAAESGAGAVTVQEVKHNGRPAYRMSDGRTEAVIVPELGRVMGYGLVDGANFLLNAPPKEYKPGEWKNYGGDKTWPAPQHQWNAWIGHGFPPDPAWDGSPHKAEVLPGGRLRMTTPVAPSIGTRCVRDFSFNDKGEFVIEQTFEKVEGEPVLLSIWSITQIVPTDAIFLPLNPKSAYKDNYYRFDGPKPDPNITQASPTLLRVRPVVEVYKIGVDTDVATIAAVKDGVAFVQRAPRPDGEYPDGAVGAGFPVEMYQHGDKALPYNELELLSPVQRYQKGDRRSHPVRWSLHKMPSKDANSTEVRDAIEKLLKTP